MKIILKKFALAVCAAICCTLFAACGNSDRGDGSGHMYNAALLGNPQSLDPQFASDPSSETVIKNLYSGLMTSDSSGNISCCNAESYSISDDGTVYTFNLRKDNFWFFDENQNDVIDSGECIPVTADDYVFAFERILDPKMQSPYAEDFSCIKGAEAITQGQAGADSAQVYAPDNYTLIIVLENPNAEFLSLLSTTAASPCNRIFFYSTKGRYGLDDRSVMSNGAFYVRQWFYDPYGVNNILYMKRNDKNWTDSFEIMPSYLSFNIEEGQDDIQELFRNKETECFTSMNAGSYNPEKYNITAISAYTLGLVFNSSDSIFTNKNVRKAAAYSIDRNSLNQIINSDLQTAAGIIPPAIRLLGRSYRELSSDNQFSCFSMEEAAECVKKAKSELKTTAFDEFQILVNTETVNSAYLTGITENLQNIFGCNVNIEEVTADDFNRRIAENDFRIALYPLSADSPNGVSVIRLFEKVDCLKNKASEINLSEGLTRCSTIDELVEKYTSAEKLILDEYSFIPVFYKNMYLIADKDNEDIFFDPFSGAVDYRLAKNYS